MNRFLIAGLSALAALCADAVFAQTVELTKLDKPLGLFRHIADDVAFYALTYGDPSTATTAGAAVATATAGVEGRAVTLTLPALVGATVRHATCAPARAAAGTFQPNCGAFADAFAITGPTVSVAVLEGGRARLTFNGNAADTVDVRGWGAKEQTFLWRHAETGLLLFGLAYDDTGSETGRGFGGGLSHMGSGAGDVFGQPIPVWSRAEVAANLPARLRLPGAEGFAPISPRALAGQSGPPAFAGGSAGQSSGWAGPLTAGYPIHEELRIGNYTVYDSNDALKDRGALLFPDYADVPPDTNPCVWLLQENTAVVDKYLEKICDPAYPLLGLRKLPQTGYAVSTQTGDAIGTFDTQFTYSNFNPKDGKMEPDGTLHYCTVHETVIYQTMPWGVTLCKVQTRETTPVNLSSCTGETTYGPGASTPGAVCNYGVSYVIK